MPTVPSAVESIISKINFQNFLGPTYYCFLIKALPPPSPRSYPIPIPPLPVYYQTTSRACLVYGRPFIFIGTIDFPTSFVFPFLTYMSRSRTFHLGETPKSILALQKMRFPHRPSPFCIPHQAGIISQKRFFFFQIVRKLCVKFGRESA